MQQVAPLSSSEIACSKKVRRSKPPEQAPLFPLYQRMQPVRAGKGHDERTHRALACDGLAAEETPYPITKKRGVKETQGQSPEGRPALRRRALKSAALLFSPDR